MLADQADHSAANIRCLDDDRAILPMILLRSSHVPLWPNFARRRPVRDDLVRPLDILQCGCLSVNQPIVVESSPDVASRAPIVVAAIQASGIALPHAA